MRKLFIFIIAFLVSASADQLYTQKSQRDFESLHKLLQQRNHNVCDYQILVKRLAENDPHAIRYATANSKEILGDKVDRYRLPFTTIKNSIFAKNTTSGEFISYVAYTKNESGSVKFSELSKSEFVQLVVCAYEQMPRDFMLQVGDTLYHRDQLIGAIQNNNALGKKLLHIEKNFLRMAENNFWEFEIDGHTDAEGNLTVDSFSFAADSELLATVQLSWRGIHESFTKAEFTVNGKQIYNGEALNFEAYQVAYDVKAKNNTCRVTAVGGPKNAAVKVVLADCG
ncbi:hypothetical protein [Candidatus Uabimicrobium amorphum]|uniref:Uncharacterized protein n=1 Tax=Uabimicrobium amorphum TaxID=2596890 RepID=A0A5S9F0Z5_UABAM|nr:hypothetical protein [Candidatus Uabimicrobium amorphum]BBM82026.1 hypothetical protein UABAM_00369 [Candidatus Uabimicrobium amorphum]